MVKVSREKALENRNRLIEVAGRLFREHGVSGVGVAEIAKAAGLSQGALYSQFSSKAELAAETLRYGKASSTQRLRDAVGDDPGISTLLEFYVSARQRDDVTTCCPLLATASDAARQGDAFAAAFTLAFEELGTSIQAALERGGVSNGRDRSLALAAAMIGGVAVARAVRGSNPRLSDEILAAVRHLNLGGT